MMHRTRLILDAATLLLSAGTVLAVLAFFGHVFLEGR
jgi:hypothetical protein